MESKRDASGTNGATTPVDLPPTARQIQMMKGADGQYGWQLREVPMPAVGDHQVLLRVRALGLQRADIEIPKMLPPDGPDLSGLVAGSDASGDIVRVGRQVRSMQVGQKVVSLFFSNYVDEPLTAAKMHDELGYTVNGVFGDYVVIDETGVAPIPDWLSYEEAAGLSTSGLTAWTATVGRGYMRKGDTVLVQGTGGVSTFALQFAIAAGGKVIAISSSDDKLKRAKAIGASEGINYRTNPEWSAKVLELTGGAGADLVVEIGGTSTLEQAMASLGHGGTLSLVGGLGGYDGVLPAWSLLMKGLTVRAVVAGSRADFLRMCDFMHLHKIHPVIERTYPFADMKTAAADLAAGNFVGKLVVRL